jgi:thiamine biosynthesis lipoprotein
VIGHRDIRGAVAAGPGGAAASSEPIVPFSHHALSMGGRLVIHLDADDGRRAEAAAVTAALVERIGRWSARLTRHSETSELSELNSDPRDEVPVGPTLAAVLRAGRVATESTEGFADITLLGARLAAEGLADEGLADGGLADGGLADEPRGRPSHAFDWSLAPGRRGSALVRRQPGMRFDLDGVGKGWIADRALRLLSNWPSAIVDADGDLAIRCAPGKTWEVAVDDPRTPDTSLTVLRLTATHGIPGQWGVATSGTSIHRWTVNGGVRHHLIDPRTGRPAATDVIQATVIAGSALRAEALAKAAVIAGSYDGLALLERARVAGAVMLTERGEAIALPQTLALMGN